MNLIWLLLRASWVNVAIAILAGLVSGAFSARLLALINNILTSSDLASVNLVSSFAGLTAIVLVTSIISQLLLVRLSENATYQLRMQLSTWILSCPLRHLEELGANRLLATLTDDVQSIANTVFVIPVLCVDIAIIGGCFIYLGWLSLSVFLVTFIFLVFAILTMQILLGKARKLMVMAREQQDRLYGQFRAITDGIKELKLNLSRRQAFLSEDLQGTANSAREYNVASLTIFSIAFSWGQLLIFVILGLLILGLPHFLTINNKVLSGYVITIIFLINPLSDLLRTMPVVNRASVALQKIESLGLSLASRSETIANDIAKLPISGKQIDIVQITHAYRGESEEKIFTLGPIDLTFRAGELAFIVGGNGSGKSTLAKAIAGLYVPESGEMRLDDRPISDNNRDWYRQHFSAVFSDFYLFERLLGLDIADLDPQARDYLVKLQIDRQVRVQDGILSTTALSQGQRKRLALLTAYLEDRPIYLFDEWASDQDPLFKEIFYQQLLPELKNRGKMVLVISHDDRYFHVADRIIKLDYGKLEYDNRAEK
jgi:putative ATP-binding cassette transporter